MIKLNQKDLELLLEVMTEEQKNLEKEIIEYDHVPDETLSRFETFGRLRVWANEQLDGNKSVYQSCRVSGIDLAHRTVMSQMDLGHLKYIGDIFLLIIESIKELQENTHE